MWLFLVSREVSEGGMYDWIGTYTAVLDHLKETLEISVRNGWFDLTVGQGPQKVLFVISAQKLAVDARVRLTFMAQCTIQPLSPSANALSVVTSSFQSPLKFIR